MDIVNIGRVRRFLRERPISVPLLDRARVVAEVLCLEEGQREARREHAASDAVYVVIEGQARIRLGAQVQDLETLDMVVVAPGVSHFIENTGSERLTVLALV